jgi:hypothetical protein
LNAATAADVCRAAARTPDIAVAAWTVIIVYLVFEGMNVVGWFVGCSVYFGSIEGDIVGVGEGGETTTTA